MVKRSIELLPQWAQAVLLAVAIFYMKAQQDNIKNMGATVAAHSTSIKVLEVNSAELSKITSQLVELSRITDQRLTRQEANWMMNDY